MFNYINKRFECLMNEIVEGRICKNCVIGCYDFMLFFGVVLFGVKLTWR